MGKVTTNSGLLWIVRVRECRPGGSDVRMFKIPGQSEVHSKRVQVKDRWAQLVSDAPDQKPEANMK